MHFATERQWEQACISMSELAPSITERLALVLSRPITASDRARAALHLVDWLGCAAIGHTTDVGRILSPCLSACAGPLPLASSSSDPAATAFALGGLGSVFEMDDVHRTALLHPGPVVIPAVLAFGTGTATEKALDAIIAGYEAMIRIGSAVGPAHYSFFHNTATCGGFGAAVAAARILGLDRAQTVAALGTAGSIAGGLWQCRNEPVMTKTFHVAEAARRGVAAALLAARGLTGPRYIFEGPQGFFAAVARDGEPKAIVADSTAPWRIFETSFKPWPACRHAHPAIDAALLIRDAVGDLEEAQIERVEVETFSDAITFCDRPEPTTAVQAKFSLQHAVSVALLSGRPMLHHFEPGNLHGNDFEALRRKVRVTASDRFTTVYPGHFGASVTIKLSDGGVVERHVADAWGDTQNPMDEAAIFAKARMLLEASGIASDAAARLVDAAASLADGAPLSVLAEVLPPPMRNP